MVGYDLAVIGSGGAAFAAAITARRAGRRVVMIERATVGGTCVNVGCVPSKALLAAAEARHIAAAQPFPGISTTAGPVDMAGLIEGKDALVGRMRAGKYVDLADEQGWDIIQGQARFVDGPELRVNSADGELREVRATHYLIATGSTPRLDGLAGIDQVDYLTSTTAMAQTDLPASLVVVGGGYVGLEQAQLFARLGVRVHLVGRFAPHTEPELAALLAGVFAEENITVIPERATEVSPEVDGLVVRTAGGRRVVAARLLLATGRQPVTDGLDPAAVGVKTGPDGQIVVDEHLRTDNPRIWSAGDVTGGPQYVYVAARHGALAATNALRTDNGPLQAVDYRHLPAVTFTSPSLASAGLTEADATARGYRCESRVLPLRHVPRALVNRDTRGAVKLVADAHTGRLLGAHLLAPQAGEVITAAVYALANQMTVTDMAELWTPYLTMAEALKLAAQTFTRDVAQLSCCAS